jgi:phenylalanyl-tRNA synthetase beta chain
LIDFDALVRHISIMPKYAPFSKMPPADRDIALVVPERTSAAAIESTVRSAAGVLLENARVFDVYQGENIGEGFKSVAVALRFRAPDRTLQEDEIEAAMQNVREVAAAKLNAQLRA